MDSGCSLAKQVSLKVAFDSSQRQEWKTPADLGVSKSVKWDTFSLQCSDTVGWAMRKASGLEKCLGDGVFMVTI